MNTEQSLRLAGLAVNIAKETDFDLASLLDHERREAIEEPGGMA